MSKKYKMKQRSAGKPDVELGQRIRARRIEAEMSQAELGAALGVSFQQVQKYEKGVNRVSATRLAEIAKAMSESLEYFTGTQTAQTSELSAMLADNASQRLLRAFHKIEDMPTRYKFVGLLESITANAA
jgi:transcriptional regulator with XRE-family HTH domain